MAVSKLFTLLVALGVLPILAGQLIDGEIYIFFIYNLLLLSLLIVDFIMTPKKNSFEISRELEEKLSLGAENPIIIKTYNKSKYNLKAAFADEIPDSFHVEQKKLSMELKPFGETKGKYQVVPVKRGEYELGTLYMKYRSVLGLHYRVYRFPLHQRCKVYPNIKDLRRFSLSGIKKTEQSGLKYAKGFNLGTEFESLREYSQGDDYRKINWNASARVNKLIVNEFQPEKNQTIFILIDSSRVMNSEINHIKKLDYAINSAFVLSEIALKKEDNIGLLIFDREIRRYVKPGKGTAHFKLLADTMYSIQENMVTSDYENALKYMNKQYGRRSLLCIFTELFNQEEALQIIKAVRGIAHKHVPLIISIRDTRLNEMTETQLKSTEDVYLKAAAMSILNEREKVKKAFQRSGIHCIDVPPDRLSLEVVNTYLEMKAKLLI